MRKEEITLSQLSGRWEAAVRYQVKPTTYGVYRTMIEKHIVPGLGYYRVGELNNRILENYLREKQEQQLAWSTLRLIIFILKGILRMGEEGGIRTGERLHYYIPQYKKPYMRVFRQENSEKLLEYLETAGGTFETGLLISICTGIRVGELCGLKWKDVNWKRGTIQINRTVSRIRNPEADFIREGPKDGSFAPGNSSFMPEDGSFVPQDGSFMVRQNSSVPKERRSAPSMSRCQDPGTAGEMPKTILYIGPPKTGTSIREIPLPDFLLLKMAEHRGEESAYLLTGTSKCMEPRGVQRRFKNILKKCGIPDTNIHSLRHWFASRWIENGFDNKALSEILGHSSIKITMDIYVHSDMEQKKAYINRMI